MLVKSGTEDDELFQQENQSDQPKSKIKVHQASAIKTTAVPDAQMRENLPQRQREPRNDDSDSSDDYSSVKSKSLLSSQSTKQAKRKVLSRNVSKAQEVDEIMPATI